MMLGCRQERGQYRERERAFILEGNPVYRDEVYIAVHQIVSLAKEK